MSEPIPMIAPNSRTDTKEVKWSLLSLLKGKNHIPLTKSPNMEGTSKSPKMTHNKVKKGKSRRARGSPLRGAKISSMGVRIWPKMAYIMGNLKYACPAYKIAGKIHHLISVFLSSRNRV
ncbi:hypothetical protein M1N92_04880 [Dehalococcoidia bacterium]|nr:hypothetical protein [Dehalococcoidia bacterium]